MLFRSKESAEMHRRIYRAIRQRYWQEARTAMRDHLMLAQKAQEEEFDQDSGSTGLTSRSASGVVESSESA